MTNKDINSTLGNIAATIEEAYNNGRVVSSDEKLTYKDFLQMCYLYYGDIASIQYYKELRAGNQNFYFSASIVKITCDVEKAKNGSPAFIALEGYALLPYMSGILAVYPYTESSLRDPDDDWIKMPAGSEGLYGKPKVMDDLGLRFFVAKMGKLELYPSEEEKVSIEYIPVDEDVEVPPQIGSWLVTTILGKVLPIKASPADTHEDTDPNQSTYKQRLDQPQSIN